MRVNQILLVGKIFAQEEEQQFAGLHAVRWIDGSLAEKYRVSGTLMVSAPDRPTDCRARKGSWLPAW